MRRKTFYFLCLCLVVLTSAFIISCNEGSMMTPGKDLASCGTCNFYGTNYPVCCNAATNWGWENNASCITAANCTGNGQTCTGCNQGPSCGTCNFYGTKYPVCCNAATNWGWENNASCITASNCTSNGQTCTGCSGGSSSSAGFHVSGNQLLDANGNNFIMKGFAVPTAWFVSDVNNNIGNMKNNTGANTMRIVCTTSMNENDWKTTVQNCINNKVIPMVELHDVTCINDWNRLNDMAKYWAARASYFNQSGIARYILINIANEWGDGSLDNSNWREAYKAAITTIRNAGIKTTLVVDAPGCGQDTNNASTMRTYWSDLQNYDPQHNLIFSVHMYGVWTGNSNPQTGIQAMRNSGMPFIVGEFADRGSFGDLNEPQVISTCASVGAGWLAWSWKGNNEPALDMSNDWAGTSLTSWGNTAVWGSNGTKTAVKASVY